MKRLSKWEPLELAPYTPITGTDADQSRTTSGNEWGPLAWSDRVAQPVQEEHRRPLTAGDVAQIAGRGALEALRFMRREKTGLSVVVLPLLIVAIKIALVWKGGPAAVELAQAELWLVWAWCVLRVFF